MNNDLISREYVEKLVEELENICQNAPEYVLELLSKIKNAPTVEERPQGEWIPVNERLPEEEDYRPCYGFEDGCVMWQTDNGDIGFGWYYNSTKCWSDIYDEPIKTGKVIAWQPLPEKYKEADNETN